ncbi:hypothetical protein MJT46_011782 [Ovis ammon polii x Ovis aries]|nr:hypothetical protein MJT46_011782 [Ovis ammon polii x Ovis aries]
MCAEITGPRMGDTRSHQPPDLRTPWATAGGGPLLPHQAPSRVTVSQWTEVHEGTFMYSSPLPGPRVPQQEKPALQLEKAYTQKRRPGRAKSEQKFHKGIIVYQEQCTLSYVIVAFRIIKNAGSVVKVLDLDLSQLDKCFLSFSFLADFLQYFSCISYNDIRVWSNMDTKRKMMRMGTYDSIPQYHFLMEHLLAMASANSPPPRQTSLRVYCTSQDNHQARKDENDLGNARETSPAKEDEVKGKCMVVLTPLCSVRSASAMPSTEFALSLSGFSPAVQLLSRA